MAVKIPYVVERDGTYYYMRRVPKAVLDVPGAKERFFQGQKIVRVSLFTSNATKAVELAEGHTRDFDARVSRALDQAAAHMPRKSRPVTEDSLRKISLQRRSAIEAQFRQYILMRELGGDAAEHAEDMLYQIEMDAESINAIALDYKEASDPRLDL